MRRPVVRPVPRSVFVSGMLALVALGAVFLPWAHGCYEASSKRAWAADHIEGSIPEAQARELLGEPDMKRDTFEWSAQYELWVYRVPQGTLTLAVADGQVIGVDRSWYTAAR